MKHMLSDKKIMTENKLINMIQQLGENFKNFLSVNNTEDINNILKKASSGIIEVNEY